jgi:hypothetical protein
MTPAEVFDSETYPNGDGALPTVSVSGTTTEYARPWLGGSDDNAATQVSTNAANGVATPIAMYVYEHQPPLAVSLSQSPGATTSSSERVAVNATVTDSSDTPIPSSALSYRWSVNGAVRSSAAAPTLSVRIGNSVIGLQVHDQASGATGIDSIQVSYNPSPVKTPPAKHPHPGAGNKHSHNRTGGPKGKPKSPIGNSHPKQSHAQTPTTHRKTHKASHRGSGTGHPPDTTPTTTTPAAPPATPPTSTPATTPPAAPTTTPGFTPVTGATKPPRHRRTAPRHPRRGPAGAHHAAGRGTSSNAAPRLVTGRLVADVNAVAPGSSPLVHPAAARDPSVPLVHAAATSTSLPAWLYATLAVVALLAAGAAYERRGRRGRSLHR